MSFGSLFFFFSGDHLLLAGHTKRQIILMVEGVILTSGSLVILGMEVLFLVLP